jgi:hypothetical protein
LQSLALAMERLCSSHATLVDCVTRVAAQAQSVAELRRAQSVILPAVLGSTLAMGGQSHAGAVGPVDRDQDETTTKMEIRSQASAARAKTSSTHSFGSIGAYPTNCVVVMIRVLQPHREHDHETLHH